MTAVEAWPEVCRLLTLSYELRASREQAALVNPFSLLVR